MKKIFCFTVLVIIFSAFSFTVSAKTFEFDINDDTDLYTQMYEDYRTEELVENTPEEFKSFAEEFKLTPSDPFSFSNLLSKDGLKYFVDYMRTSLSAPLKYIAIILISIIVCALSASMSDNSLQTNYSLNVVCTLVCTAALLLPFNSLLGKSVEAVGTVSVFMGIFIPVFAGILIACLKSGTATAYSSVMFFTCEAVSYCCKIFVFPFVNCYTALSIASGITGAEKLSGITKLMKRISLWIIGAAMALFLAVLSVQSVISSTVDSASSKTAKFLISSFIPIIGPSVSEALGSLRGCISLLKSSAGIYAVLVIVFMFLPVIIEIIAYKFVMSFCADISDMFSVSVLKNILEVLNSALSIILSVVLCVALMFIFSITIVSVTGGNV